MKKVLLSVGIFFIGLMCLISIPLFKILSLPDDMCVTKEDIAIANYTNSYKPFTFCFDDNLPVGVSEDFETEISVKLLNLITIKKININLINDTEVFAGGIPLGFSLVSDGVIIVETNPILTNEGEKTPMEDAGLKEKDVIITINGKKVSTIEDVENSASDGTPLTIEYIRNNEKQITTLTPAFDILTNRYKLGFWIKNNSSGIGTLTYVKKSNGRFGAIGHPISENYSSNNFEISSGNVYPCSILGIKKGTPAIPGELRGTINFTEEPVGIADTNCKYGVFGNITQSEIVSNNKTLNLSGRLSIKKGKAYILSDLDGEGIKSYEIKITKLKKQKNADDKSITFKVTDKSLLLKTGGIIQGMSGSPIIQNGKLIGSVTHVFSNDPTKGYGVYIDWMINN